MKKIIAFLFLMTVCFFLIAAVAQPRWSRNNNRHVHEHVYSPQQNNYHYQQQQTAYDFYPAVNVYYNPASRRFFYPRGGVWISTDVLPRNICLQEERYTVYCNEQEPIWKNNVDHCYRYGRSRRRSDVVVIAPQPRRNINIVIGARF